ncbi:6-phosphogluconolactonase [Lewinella aquimaris]|uniref:6-phosphogluconolactonase n=1 Tax=Neolewinella aquimaris TaxID=1835722 RepID=A0A840E472_9BACT|nr:beta-propeller fold lactonase family protein [Neolewinella aquimaris]MBB4078542.1 6-phosphogluconolactonase [Neolewinella aquimaris]
MLLLVGAYTLDMEDGVPGRARGISAYDFYAGEGRLEFRGYTPTVNPSYLWVDEARKIVYAIRECPQEGGPGVVAYRVIRERNRSVTFEKINDVHTPGDHPCHLMGIDDTLVVSSYTSGTLDVFARGTEGELGEHLQHIELPPVRPGHPPRAHCTAFDRRRNRAYVCDLGSDRLLVFDRSGDGCLTLLADHGVELPEGSGPRHLALHPSGDYATIICEYHGITLLVDLKEDKPRLVKSALYLPERAVDRASGAAITTDASGKNVYVSDRKYSVVTALRLDVREPRYQPRDTYPSGGERPRDINLSPDGQWLLTANVSDHTIGVFRVQAGGVLQLHHVVKKVPSPTCLKWMKG